MIVTVVSTEGGKLQAVARGDVRPPNTDKPVKLDHIRCGLMAGPGQKIQVVDVPDSYADLFADPDELTVQLTATLAARGLL
jgi:hypothetical protein